MENTPTTQTYRGDHKGIHDAKKVSSQIPNTGKPLQRRGCIRSLFVNFIREPSKNAVDVCGLLIRDGIASHTPRHSSQNVVEFSVQ